MKKQADAALRWPLALKLIPLPGGAGATGDVAEGSGRAGLEQQAGMRSHYSHEPVAWRYSIDGPGHERTALAQEISAPANRISAIVAGQRSVTGETALRLARYFGTTPAYWINLQAHYDLEAAKDAWAEKVAREVRPRSVV